MPKDSIDRMSDRCYSVALEVQFDTPDCIHMPINIHFYSVGIRVGGGAEDNSDLHRYNLCPLNIFHWLTLARTFSNEAGLTSEKQIRNTSWWEKKEIYFLMRTASSGCTVFFLQSPPCSFPVHACHSLTPKAYLVFQINLLWMSVDCGRKSECSQKTHADTVRIYKLQPERP